MEYKVLESILKFSVGTISVSAIIIFLLKIIFNKLIDVMILNYQAELNRRIEEFKINKQNLIEENKIVFSKLHQDRAEVIRELYGMLVEIEEELNNYKFYTNINEQFKNNMSEIKDIEEKLSTKLIPDFHYYIRKNKIYFSDDIWEVFENIDESFYVIFTTYREKNDAGTTILKAGYEMLSESESYVDELKKYLEVEFRKLLGVD